ncbi:uracil-DNA glycosylase family protein [Tropicimonas sp. IMCC34043]|uniref:uracil-DNA glycosylase n=1 Tax=Tropicimonas sp. IMCC34043 TaxID=2248760 RepID=UPI000E2631F3|nr:uracil-DNA glycosylase [Tropicimonas sp. IMCC34043]
MEHDVPTKALLAALEYQIALGADEAIGLAPVDRLARAAASEQPAPEPRPRHRAGPVTAVAPVPLPPVVDSADPVGEARALAGAATSLAALNDALAGFEHCELKRGARSLVFADGNPGARVMIIGEAPGRDEDIEGRPFVGRAGQLLDRMFAAIGLDRLSDLPESALYITNILPWRPPQNRDPEPEEIAMLKPFVERHVALVAPRLLVLMGNISCQAMLGRRGITRLRGQWTEALGLPVLPMFHPAYLLRNPAAKREAWADLLELKARLRKDAEGR